MLRFSPTIEAGHILQAIMLAGAVAAAWGTLRADISHQEQRVAVLEARADERQAGDRLWRAQVTESMKEITITLGRLNESVIRLDQSHRAASSPPAGQ